MRSNERQERKSSGEMGDDREDHILVGTEGRWRSGGEMARVPRGPDQRE